MGRRTIRPVPVSSRDLGHEYVCLGRFALLAPELYEAIRGERDRIDALGGPVQRKVARLREFIDELGYGDEAARFVSARAADRERYQKGRGR